MVANGIAMQDIMKSTQMEAKIAQGMAKKTQKLSESMRQDSLSMKTVRLLLQRAEGATDSVFTSKIAALTMFFLPGTSFAVSGRLSEALTNL